MSQADPYSPLSPSASQSASRVVKGACPHDCPDTCALKITVENERVIKVQGAAEHRSTHGALCTKVSRYAERTYHAERVLRPLKRVSAKHEAPRFEPVSWREALDDIAARLQAIAARDPQAILPYSYAGTMGLIQGESISARFFNRLGASRLDRTICAGAGGAAMTATYGHKVGMHLPFFAESKLILIWGSNSIASNLHFWTFANQAKRAGAKLICIDPRKTETADKCHQHIALLPGSDGALALGLMHELIQHDWLDHDYLNAHVDGWDELKARALQWPPERVAEVCGITAEEVVQLARDYGQTQPAAIRLNYGMQRVRGGGNAVRLVALLPCLTGAWRNRAGGLLLSASGWVAPFKNSARLEKPELLQGPEPRIINMSTIGDDLLRPSSADFGPRIEALIVYNSNPVAVAPESPKVVSGFARSDLFTVVLEHFMTDTADLADYVLPATTQLEHLDVHTSYGHTDVLINEQAIAPIGEAKSNTQIFRELAAAMGFTEPCFAETDEQLARQAFTSAIDFEALRAQGWQSLPLADAPFAAGGFPTANGRVQAAGADYVANYESRASNPDLARRYPLAMISPPARNFLNSSFVNVKSLRDIEGEPLVEVHAEDAAARGLQDGAMVRVFNDRGSYVCRLAVSARARPGVVNGLGVWWRKLGAAGSNVNEVTHQGLTDMGQAPSFYDCLVELEALAA
ncbi:anaerobic selenocysteine-containing dehydrogenase [Paucibacter oligotrophus]|uniref:Anaerobic selenocysteine-containing dehydrogenase n=1 Tax=Roseateles oligotrophus TaxID=1769250 RepID=A0A840LGV0_9BURK|nr:molybdopterin oxidoreductase family protein [Roseateles oligotrophus]MBB4845833.1 anaerobic selenocysteine-containing dehydrogenase [Roseateles oligotrophus]